MEEWFGSKAPASFDFFGPQHVVMIILYLIGMVFLAVYLKKFNNHHKLSHYIRWGLFLVLVSSELSYQVWGIVNNMWNPREYLPFQLCSIAGILTMVGLFTKHPKVIQIIFFIGIVPSFLAVVTPELHHGYPHFRYWQFFIHHIALSWGSLFLVVTTSMNITFKKTLETYLYLLCYAGIMGFILNPLLQANFLFLAKTPSANTPLDLLGNGFMYYVNLCLVGFIVFLAIYGAYQLIKRKI